MSDNPTQTESDESVKAPESSDSSAKKQTKNDDAKVAQDDDAQDNTQNEKKQPHFNGMDFISTLNEAFEKLGFNNVGSVRFADFTIGPDGVATPVDHSADTSSHDESSADTSAKLAQDNTEKRKNDKNDPLSMIRSFSMNPREIRDYLDRYVISQGEAKKVLATAVCDHYNHVRRCLEHPEIAARDFAKSNVLMLGPTGVGKTYLMRCIAKLIGVPFVKADATKFSETGYVGYDVEDIIRDLVKAANNDINLAQYGIVYIDEIDKIASKTSDGQKDVSGRGVQTNLLKLLEESDVRLLAQNDMLGQMQAMMSFQRRGTVPPSTISTKYILFIVSGAFVHLDDIVRRRLGNSVIGFNADRETAKRANGDDAAMLKYATNADLVKYGFEPEFIGRLPVRVSLDELSVDDLEKILTTAENGIWEQYQEVMAGYDIALSADHAALRKIAEEAAEEKTGARGLLTVLERLFRNFKFELPGRGVSALNLTAEMVENPDKALQQLIASTLSIDK